MPGVEWTPDTGPLGIVSRGSFGVRRVLATAHKADEGTAGLPERFAGWAGAALKKEDGGTTGAREREMTAGVREIPG